jgi:hypothetical protein
MISIIRKRLSLPGAAERIMHYLESEGVGGVILRCQSRNVWAAELGLTHGALYGTSSRLRAEGRLGIDGPRIALAHR